MLRSVAEWLGDFVFQNVSDCFFLAECFLVLRSVSCVLRSVAECFGVWSAECFRGWSVYECF